MTRVRNLLLLSLWFILPASSHALEVFGNGVLTDASFVSNSGFSFGAHDAYAVPFSTGNSTLAQRTVEGAYVLVGGASTGHSFNVAIYTDTGTNADPGSGTVVASKEVVYLDAAPVQWAHATFSSAVVLTANANYYLVVQSTDIDASDLLWTVPTNSSAYSNLGSGSFYQITGGDPSTADIWARLRNDSTWSKTGGTTVSTNSLGLQLVPEPSTWAMGLIGAITLVTCRKRLLRRA